MLRKPTLRKFSFQECTVNSAAFSVHVSENKGSRVWRLPSDSKKLEDYPWKDEISHGAPK